MKRFLNLKLIIVALLVLTVMVMAFPAAAAADRPEGQFEYGSRGDEVERLL